MDVTENNTGRGFMLSPISVATVIREILLAISKQIQIRSYTGFISKDVY